MSRTKMDTGDLQGWFMAFMILAVVVVLIAGATQHVSDKIADDFMAEALSDYDTWDIVVFNPQGILDSKRNGLVSIQHGSDVQVIPFKCYNTMTYQTCQFAEPILVGVVNSS